MVQKFLNNINKKITIIAPHPDDELIGCYSLFKYNLVDKVIYIKDKNLDSDRFKESTFLSERYKFEKIIVENIYDFRPDDNDFYFVPSPLDDHPLHKIVYHRFYDINKGIYSIDMNTPYVKELSNEDKEIKFNMLNLYYPSQKELWQYNAKYYLFESIILNL